MADLAGCLHVCSGPSVAGNLREMVKLLNGADRAAIAYSEMLENVGPLNLLHQAEARLGWFESIGCEIHLFSGYVDEGRSGLIRQWQSFWTRINGWAGPFAIWFSSKNALDLSLLLALSDRIGDRAPVYLIDVGVKADGADSVSDAGELRPQQMLARTQSAKLADERELGALRSTFAAFAAVPGELRLFNEERLTGASADALDQRLLSCMQAGWSSLKEVVADTPGVFGNSGYRDFHYTYLLWRIEELNRAGIIERCGGGFDPTFEDDPLAGDVRLTAG